MRILLLIGFVVSLVVWTPPIDAQDIPGSLVISQAELKQIASDIEKSEKVFPSFEAEMQILHFKNGKQDANTLLMRLLVGIDRSIALYLEPAVDKGKALLSVGTSYWFFFPKADRSIRISPRSKLYGQALYGDIVKPPLLKYYHYEIIKAFQNKKNEKIAVVEFTAKEGVKNITFYRKVCYYDIERDLLLKSESYTKSGFHYATATYSDFRKLNDINMPMKNEIRDPKKPEEYTVINYTSLKQRDFPAHVFTPAYLPNLKDFR